MGQFTQSSANRNYALQNMQMNAAGVVHVHLIVTNDAGKVVDRITVTIPASGPIVDDQGVQLAASVPGGLNTARNSFLTALDSAIDAAAAAGKLEK
jgi:hypothetical protein